MTDPIERIIRMVVAKSDAIPPWRSVRHRYEQIYRECAPAITEEFEAWSKARRDIEELERLEREGPRED